MSDEVRPTYAEVKAETERELDAYMDAWKQAIREHLNKSEPASQLESRGSGPTETLSPADTLAIQSRRREMAPALRRSTSPRRTTHSPLASATSWLRFADHPPLTGCAMNRTSPRSTKSAIAALISACRGEASSPTMISTSSARFPTSDRTDSRIMSGRLYEGIKREYRIISE